MKAKEGENGMLMRNVSDGRSAYLKVDFRRGGAHEDTRSELDSRPMYPLQLETVVFRRASEGEVVNNTAGQQCLVEL